MCLWFLQLIVEDLIEIGLAGTGRGVCGKVLPVGIKYLLSGSGILGVALSLSFNDLLRSNTTDSVLLLLCSSEPSLFERSL